MAQFILKINLGNDAMQTGYDLSRVICDVGSMVQDIENITDETPFVKTIRDINGNAVGSCGIVNTFVPNCKKFNCNER